MVSEYTEPCTCRAIPTDQGWDGDCPVHGLKAQRTPAPHAELVRRLRETHSLVPIGGHLLQEQPNALCQEAADAIENLTELLAVKQGIIDVVKSTLDDWGITYDETGVDAE